MGMKIKKNGKIISLSESDLKRIASVVLIEDTKGDTGKIEDRERFTLSDVASGACGKSGKWEINNGSLILTDCNIDGFMVDASIVSCKDEN